MASDDLALKQESYISLYLFYSAINRKPIFLKKTLIQYDIGIADLSR